MLKRPKSTLLTVAILPMLVMGACLADAYNVTSRKVGFSFQNFTIKPTEGFARRDPSDVIRVGDTWYVWYSRVNADSPAYPSGYDATIWYAVSADEGRTWEEKGEALARGKEGAWDCTSVFTPNILKHGDTYFLYYTAVGPKFRNRGYSDTARTAIGVATASSPDGPWTRSQNNPILESTRDPEKFDSFRVDDSCLAVREGKVWLYYKGRQWKNTPANTKMGVAVGPTGEGPFERMNEGNPVQMGGHEVQIWVGEQGGVYSLVSGHGPEGIRHTVQYAADGLHFVKWAEVEGRSPAAPGLYRPELTDPDAGGMPVWGIHGRRVLGRYEMNPSIEMSLPGKIAPKNASRHQGLIERVNAADKADILFIGDSITHYWETRGGEVWKEYFGDMQALNLGIEGNRTWHVLWRLKDYDLEKLDPKVAVVLIGTNNIGLSKLSGGQSAVGVTALVEYLRERLSDTDLILLGLFPRGRANGWAQKQVDIVNAQISKLSDAGRIHYRDIGSKFLKPDGEIDVSLMPDRLHLSAEGYKIWAETIKPEIERLIALNTDRQ